MRGDRPFGYRNEADGDRKRIGEVTTRVAALQIGNGRRSNFALGAVVFGFAVAMPLLEAFAEDQTAVTTADSSMPAQADAGDEDDVTRPIRSFDLRYQFQDQSVVKQKDFQYVIPRINWRFDLSSEWRLGLRLDMPIAATNQISLANPDGDYLFGMGRLLGQAYIAALMTDRWAAGFGSQLVAPALSGGEFGSKAWDVLPGMAVRYMLPELSAGSFFAPLVRYDISSSRDETTGRRNSNLQFAPELKVMLPEQWFVELYPSADIRINFGQPIPGQTGRSFVPIDGMVGRNLTDDTTVSLEVSAPVVRDYPVYLLKVEARISTKF